MHANGSRGDLAEGFAFASFFPNVLQPPMAALGNALFTLLVKIKVCQRPIRRYDVGGSSAGPSISISLPGIENHDTERRRQIALKALSDRLNKTPASGAEKTAWPTMEEDDQAPLIPKQDQASVHSPKPETDAVIVDIDEGTATDATEKSDKKQEQSNA